MEKCFKKHARKLLSQVPIILVLLDLHFEGIEGVEKAESQKHLSRGNQLLNAGQLADALTHFHTAIDKDDRNYQAYYMRATVYLAMGKARSALPDLHQVVKLQPSFVQARLQRGNLFLKMGKFNEAQTDYEVVLAHEDHLEATAKVEEIRPLRRNVNHASKLLEAKDFHGAINLLNQVIESCPWNADYREMRALAFEHLGDLRRAISDLKPTTILKLDNTRAFLRMSILWYNLGDVEQSLDEIRECLKLDPDHAECYAHYKSVKKLFKTLEAAKNKMAQGDWTEAVAKYRKALAQESRIHQLNIEVKLKICECFVKAHNPVEAIKAANDVIALDSSNIPVLLLLSQAHTQNEDYQEAVDDLQRAAQIDENYPGLPEKLKKAQKLLKQSQKRDYYKILGVSRNAGKKDIIKAYRKLAREWHPDNFQDEEEKKRAEKKFIEIASAKEVLSDQAKVRIFNDGYDPLDTEDVAEWEKQQALGRSGNLFEFFFQHNAGGRKKEKSEDNPFEELFKSFSEHRRRTTPRMDPLADGFDRPNPNARRPQPKQQFNEQKTKQTDPTSQDQHFRQFQHQDPRFQQQQERTQPYGRQPTQNKEPPPPQPQQPRQQYQQQRSSTDQQRSGQQQRQQSQGHSKRWQSGEEDRFRSAWQQRNRDQRQDPLHATQHQQFSQQRQSHPNPRQQTSQSQHQFERPHQSFGSQHQPIKNRQNYQTDFDEQQRQHAGDPRQYQQGKATKDDKSYRRSDRQSEPQQYEDGRQSADQRQRHHDEKPVLKKTTKKKKTSFKKKRTMTAEEKEITKQYTRGTDGRWYHKGKDGRWRVHNGPPPDPTKKKVPPTQTRKTQSSSKQSQQSQQRQSNKPDAEQKPNENSYRDEKGNIYVRGLDGNWYMRVQPPPKKQDDKKSDRQEQWDNQKQATDQHWTHRPHNKNKKQDSRTRFQQTQRSQYDGMNQEARSRSQDQHQTSFQSQQQQQHHKGEHRSTTAHSQQQRQAHGTSSDLPRGLFYNERQQISDRIGNIYERLPDGRYKLFMAASEARQRLKDQLRNHKQSDFLKPKGEERPTPPPPLPKQQVYHDSEGNVFVKDAHGNLIKVQPGQQGKAQTPHQQQQSHTRQEMPRKDKTGFSYEDPNQRRAEQKWRKQEEKVDYGDEGSNQQQSHPPPNRQQYHAYAGQQRQQFQARQQDSRYTRGSQPRQFTRQRTQGGGHQHYHRDYQQSARHHRPAHEEL